MVQSRSLFYYCLTLSPATMTLSFSSFLRGAALALVIALTAACSRPAQEPAPARSTGTAAPATAAPAPAPATPLNAELASIYQRSCAACHESAGMGSPLRGDAAAWSARSADMQVLLASVKNGKNAMPPMGMCSDCSDAQLTALIDYLKAPR